MVEFTQPITQVIDTYFADYLEFHGRELNDNRRRLNILRREFGARTTLVPMDVERFFMSMREKTPATRNRFRSRLSHLIKWAIERELATGSLPKAILQKEPENNERTRRLSQDEEAKLLRFMPLELHDCFLAALDTGLRKGALMQLRFGDVKEGAIVVRAATQKHKKTQIIPLTKRLAGIIERRAQESRPSDVIFTCRDWKREWARARKRAGMEDFHWHDLRGEFASRLSELGVQVPVVSKLLGHGSLTTTQRYLRPRVEQFREAIDKLGV